MQTVFEHKTRSMELISEPVPFPFSELTAAEHIMCFKDTKGYTLTFLTMRLAKTQTSFQV